MMIAPTFFLILIALFNVVTSETAAAARTSFLHFAFPGFEAPVYYDEYERLLGPNVLKMCVRREYPPESGEQCRGVKKVCLWGSQRCTSSGGPDSTISTLEPTTRCNCQDNEWTCQAFLCPTMEGTCPEKPSLGIDDVSSLPICKTDLTCGYMEKTCADCDVTVPTIQCSCQAGQPFSCQEVDHCTANVKCSILKVAAAVVQQDQVGGDASVETAATTTTTDGEAKPQTVDLFPDPIIVHVKKDVPPPPSYKANSPSCPRDVPKFGEDTDIAPTTCTEEGLACRYGYSCCCVDESQCSADIKCDCVDGVLECKQKVCDAFLCAGPPPLLVSPFGKQEDIITSGHVCPSEQDALATETCVMEKGVMEFYHCVYGYSCCCPNSPSSVSSTGGDFSGRYCSSDLQCTCNQGKFSCDVAKCPICPVLVEDVQCPEVQPEHHSVCSNPDGGETCGFGKVTCCNGKEHAASYCTCMGNGEWDCFDADYLCDMEVC